nr:hypothetical protein [Streptococcus sp. DD10]
MVTNPTQTIKKRSALHPQKRRLKRTAITYSILTIFLLIFSQIYLSKSFGETSLHMTWLPILPLLGGIGLIISLKVMPNLSRLSYNLWNSTIAITIVGFLFRGIVNLSGRSTTLDTPYWIATAVFAILTLIALLFTRSRWEN